MVRGSQPLMESPKLTSLTPFYNKRESLDSIDQSFVQLKKLRGEVDSECDVMNEMAVAVVQPCRALCVA